MRPIAHTLVTLPLTIGGMRVDVETEAGDFAEVLRAKYGAFFNPDAPVLAHVKITHSTQAHFRPVEAGAWQIETVRTDSRLTFTSYFEQGEFDFSNGSGVLTLAPRGDPENYLRVLFAHLALDRGGLVLHACGIIRNGRGYCFFGPSTYGKTTVASLSPHDTILSDDMVLTLKQNGRYYIFGVPFRGDLPEAPRTNASAPLAGLFALVKSNEVRLDKLPTARALAELLSVVPFVMKERSSRERVIARVTDLMANIAPRALHFRRDPEFWRIIEQDA